ncbi:hypothetical protein N665_0079s0111 [Sinapis alba]|nr:hypothetical protein N665_0079s0111 [Sinapis alba]
MSRRVRQRRVDEDRMNKVGSPSYLVRGGEDLAPTLQESVDWTSLSYDPMLQVFTLLDNRDRASLASTCKAWRSLGASPHLWRSLDLRGYKFDHSVAASLANRCADALQKVTFRGFDSAAALVNLNAKNLREISCEDCNLTDATLSMIAARHEALEVLELGPQSCERITNDAIKVVAICCPKLKKLRLSGMRVVNYEAILSLAKHCPQLSDIGFVDCFNINEEALGKVVSLRYLSVAGITRNINWKFATESWEKLPNLTGLDVSRTNIDHVAVSSLLRSSQSLKVVCAVNCPFLQDDADFNPDRFKGKLLIAMFNNALNGMASIFEENSKEMPKETTLWLECVLSRTLLLSAERNSLGLSSFWQSHGAKLFLRLMQSSQEDVQERAATGLAAFVQVDDYEKASERAQAVMRDGGIAVLLKLAGSWKEGFQSEAAKAIAKLSLNDNAAKAVDEEGGVDVLLGLAMSKNRFVAEEAAGGLWNLSLGDAYKAIAQAGGVNVLMELIFRWPYGYGRLMERAAGALANLAGDDKCSREIAEAGGVHALVMLIRNCMYEGAQEHAARGLANLAAHGDSNNNIAAIGQETGALETLIQMTNSHHGGVKQEAAGALWNLAYDEKNIELISGLGGVEALVALAKSCMDASGGLQASAAGALWSLSHSEENSIVIGREGGILPLVTLARSQSADVHRAAAGALWNLSFNEGNALRIVEDGGTFVLVRICVSSTSKMARFLASLTLAYIFDGRLDKCVKENTRKSVWFADIKKRALKTIERFTKNYMNPQISETAASSSTPSALAQALERVCIQEADILRCSEEEIGRFVTMLRNSSPVLKTIAAYALLQFTIPGASHAKHHASLMQTARNAKLLRSAAAAKCMPRDASICVKVVLRNLEHHHQP